MKKNTATINFKKTNNEYSIILKANLPKEVVSELIKELKVIEVVNGVKNDSDR